MVSILGRICPAEHARSYEFAQLLRSIDDAPNSPYLSDRGQTMHPLTVFAARFLPWETERLRRSVAQAYKRELYFWNSLYNVHDVYFGVPDPGMQSFEPLLPIDEIQSQLFGPYWGEHYGSYRGERTWYDVVDEATAEMRSRSLWRMWILAMQLHQWRIIHGEFPDTLGELVQTPKTVHTEDLYGHLILYIKHQKPGKQVIVWPHHMPEYSRAKTTPFLYSHNFPDWHLDLVEEPVWKTREFDILSTPHE